MQVIDRTQFDVEQVADLAVRVGVVADAVELQIDKAKAGFGGFAAKFFRFGELDTVRRCLHRVVTNLTCIADGIQEVGAERRLTARILHRHLTTRLDLNGVVEDLADILHRKLVNETDLVRVHKARIAHHVAAVGQIDRQNRSAAVLDRRCAVIVELFVIVRFDIASREQRFDVLQELGVDRHHVFEMAVIGAILDHPHLAVAFDDLCLDLADLFIDQHRHIFLYRPGCPRVPL